MQPRRLLTSSSPGQNLCRITAAYPANDLLRPLPPQGRGLFFSNYRDTNGAVNVYGLCGFSTHWPGGHCQGTPSLTLTFISSCCISFYNEPSSLSLKKVLTTKRLITPYKQPCLNMKMSEAQSEWVFNRLSRTPAPDAFAWNGPSISTGFSDRRHNRAVIQRALDPYGESLMGTLVIQQNCEAVQESAHPRWMRK